MSMLVNYMQQLPERRPQKFSKVHATDNSASPGKSAFKSQIFRAKNGSNTTATATGTRATCSNHSNSSNNHYNMPLLIA